MTYIDQLIFSPVERNKMKDPPKLKSRDLISLFFK